MSDPDETVARDLGGEATRITPPTTPSKGGGERGWPEIAGLTIAAELGRGGMGAVYRGRQEYLGRDVAVKVLRSAGMNTEGDFVARFQREARLLAALDHPHIVRCHEAGVTAGGECYLVMELVVGSNLREWLVRYGPLSEAEALRITRELAEALHHAHGKGIIHRDVKPENVLLTGAAGGGVGRVKLVDLGLARPQLAGGAMQLTAAGMVLGTPTTMAPEQFDDPEGVDFRADIYGLGCVLFEALTGRLAFTGSTFTALIDQKRSGQVPDPRDLVGGLRKQVADLVRRCLQSDRTRRPGSYEELLAALDALEDGAVASGAATRRIAPARRERRVGSLALVVIALGLIGFGMWWWWQTRAPAPVVPGGPGNDLGAAGSRPPPPDQELVDPAPTALAVSPVAILDSLRFAEPQPWWQEDFTRRFADWETRSGHWFASEDRHDAFIAAGASSLARPLTQLPACLLGRLEAIDVGEGLAAEFGVLLRDAAGQLHGFAIKNLGAVVGVQWTTGASVEELQSSGDFLTLGQGGQDFRIEVAEGAVRARVGIADLPPVAVTGPCSELLLFCNGGGVQVSAIRACAPAEQ